MLDLDNIYTSIRTSLITSIGSRLSTLTTPTGEIPSIIRARQDGARPQNNYITMDIEDIVLPSGWILESIVQDDGQIRYTILYEVYVAIKCFGDDSKSILQQYHSMFCIDDGVRTQLREDAGLATHKMASVKPIPDFLQTNHEERSLMRLSFYVHDTIITGGYVALINGLGEFKEGEEIKVTSVIAVDASEEA